MISTDFAPNEEWNDAWASFKLLFQPWRWKRGVETEIIKKNILDKFFPNRHIALFLTGRAALYYLLKSLHLPSGSEVLVQGFTCEAVVLPIIAAGLKPIYIDIESDTFSMDINSLTRKLVNNGTNKTRVLILQHTFGLTPKYREQILSLAKKYNLIVIEDLAHGFDPTLFKSINYQLLTTTYYLLSFGRSKAISSVFGGAIVTSNQLTQLSLIQPSYLFIFRLLLYKPLAMIIKSTFDFYIGKVIHFLTVRTGLIVPEISKKEKNTEYDKMYEKAYPNALSILLLNQLKKYDRMLKIRSKSCEGYQRILAGKTGIKFPKTDLPLIRFPVLVKNRDEIIAKAAKANIFLGKWYDHVVAPKSINLSKAYYKMTCCIKAEELTRAVVNLPTLIPDEEKSLKKCINFLH